MTMYQATCVPVFALHAYPADASPDVSFSAQQLAEALHISTQGMTLLQVLQVGARGAMCRPLEPDGGEGRVKLRRTLVQQGVA